MIYREFFTVKLLIFGCKA